MISLPPLKDRTFTPGYRYPWYERLLLQFINDERDMPFVRLCLFIQLVMFPLVLLLFSPLLQGWYWWSGVALYAVCWFATGFSFTLMLHDTSHRRFFKRQHQWGNYLIPWIYSPLFGETPGTFCHHHIGMHHAENNQMKDLSSTMPYQRDSIIDFLKYFLRFFFVGIPELAIYFMKRGQKRKAIRVLSGEAAFYVLCILAAQIRLDAACVTLLAPYVIIRFSLMAGNWAQHAFIDSSGPGNPYLNCITCLNTIYNKVCYNDGYHVGHHASPHRHWTDMPEDFLKNRERYVAHQSIIFNNLHYFQIWALLMTKRYDRLCTHLVNLNNMFDSDATAIQVMKKRLQKFPTTSQSGV